MTNSRLAALLCAAFLPVAPAASAAASDDFQAELDRLRADYDARLQALEEESAASSTAEASPTLFNPAMSVILDGGISAYDNNPDEYALPGFALGGEAGLAPEGISLSHSEISASANIDPVFYGKLTMALAEHAGETDVELEEAYIETIALGEGFTLRGGRFFPGVGYLNQKHEHAWDFADAPLIYSGIWGGKYIDDGVRLSWLSPTDLFLEIGAEVFAGGSFPAGGESSSGIGSVVYFVNIGGDIGFSQSWQAGTSYYSADVNCREAGGHDHGASLAETPSFSGDSNVAGVSLVYKWAPDGNYKYRHFKLQAEYFARTEKGEVEMLNSLPLETTGYDGRQRGYYVQATYHFQTQWGVGLRHDGLASDNQGSDPVVLADAGLDSGGFRPRRDSMMVEWLPSEFSRIRLQYNHDQSYQQQDNQVMLQYTMNMGAHGAHSY